MSTPNANIHFTLVGSNFHDSFVDSLKSKPRQYTYNIVRSFTEYKAPDERDIQVIVLNGHDDDLAKPTTLATLLEQPVVLAFFAPSKEILYALHKAANSLVAIPSIKLEDGVPIIIHRRPQDNVISITPGFSILTESPMRCIQVRRGGEVPGEAADDSTPVSSISRSAPVILTPEEKLAMNFAKSVHVISVTVDYLLELLQSNKVPSAMEDDLAPPHGTMYYKTSEMLVVFTGNPKDDPEFHVTSTDQRFDYVSRLRVHAYCANAKPTDPNFTQNGGIVYVVAVLSGQVARDPTHNLRNLFPTYATDRVAPMQMHWFVDSASYKISQPQGGTLTAVNCEPQGGSTNGLETSYDIGFGTSLSLWKASQMFNYTVKYEDSFKLTQFKQKIDSQKQGDYSALMYYDNYYDKSVGEVPHDAWMNVFAKSDPEKPIMKPFPEDNIPLNALFAWTTTSLSSETIVLDGNITYVGFKYGFPSVNPYDFNFFYKMDGQKSGSTTYVLDLSSWN